MDRCQKTVWILNQQIACTDKNECYPQLLTEEKNIPGLYIVIGKTSFLQNFDGFWPSAKVEMYWRKFRCSNLNNKRKSRPASQAWGGANRFCPRGSFDQAGPSFLPFGFLFQSEYRWYNSVSKCIQFWNYYVLNCSSIIQPNVGFEMYRVMEESCCFWNNLEVFQYNSIQIIYMFEIR